MNQIFVEKINLLAWLLSILPFLIVQSLREGRSVKKIYYLDATKPGLWLANLTVCMAGGYLQRFQFRFFDIRDQKGGSLGLKIRNEDLTSVQQKILARPEFKVFSHQDSKQNYLLFYLAKKIVEGDSGTEPLFKTLFLIRVIKQHCDNIKPENENEKREIVLLLIKRPWIEEIRQYARSFGIDLKEVPRFTFQMKGIVKDIFGPRGMRLLRRFLWQIKGLRFFSSAKRHSSQTCGNLPPRIVTEYYGHLNLDNPEQLSDLFFFNHSGLKGEDLFLAFFLSQDPLDEKKQEQLRRHNISPIVFHPAASHIPSVSVCTFQENPYRQPEDNEFLKQIEQWPRSPESQWLRKEVTHYFEERSFWQSLFETFKIKVYVTWFKYTSFHCLLADAMNKSHGIMVIYQRSFEEFSSPDITVAADVVFNFSMDNAPIISSRQFNIPYHVTVGYLQDYRFSLWGKKTIELRGQIEHKGAKYVMAYFDENSMDDERWHLGHRMTRENYSFLLKKVLNEPWFGLILKPKAFLTLRHRLGDIADLISRAQETGRCLVLEDGAIQVSYPPAAAALASDICVHGHFFAMTAGMEAALAGVPTFMLDREGFLDSKLNKLGRDRVIFSDLEKLWQACLAHRTNKNLNLGDWTCLLNDLDLFRDGRAAERMGVYLKWLLDGFKEGKPRDRILSDAAERYGRLWGYDKIKKFH